MARSKSFLSAMNQMAREAERSAASRQRAVVQQQKAAEREYARAVREAEKADREQARVDASLQKKANAEAKRRHAEARTAEAEQLNAALAATYEDIDGILAATLEVDDFVDLESLRITDVQHPPFESKNQEPLPRPADLVYPPEPGYADPPSQGGLFGAKKKHQQQIAQARAAHEQAAQQWVATCQQMYDEHLRTLEKWEAAERTRVKRLAIDQAEYEAACESRRQEAAQVNAELDTLLSGLAFDVPEAIEEYVGIVLSNSVYPATFPVEHDYEFDLATRELDLRATIPGPDEVPAVKEYKWVKASDEITATKLTLKAQRDRYSSAVAQVAVRTLHEVFEADRHGRIHSISLIVQVHRISPATGLDEDVPLVAVAADRDRFSAFDLTQVDPVATIDHLGGALSKKPWDLLAVDPAGVRGAGTP